jgi:hypothetical protein
MDQELERYLNDHLAGSSGALLLIDEIAEKSDHPDARIFFHKLRKKVEADRALLGELQKAIDKEPSAILKAAGNIAARMGGLKLMWEGIEPGSLGMFEALEMLALGVQGKRLLWRVLQEIQPWFPEWSGYDFADLELEAIRQRDEVEAWRIKAARESLISEERRQPQG